MNFKEAHAELSVLVRQSLAMSHMEEILRKAAEAEKMAADHAKLVADYKAEIVECQDDLAAVAQEYANLQATMQEDKNVWAQMKRAKTMEVQKHEKECEAKMKAAEDEMEQNLARLNRVYADAVADHEAAIEEKGQKLLDAEKKLEDAQAALAVLKEKL